MGGQKRPGRARERRREWLTTIVAITQEKEKEGRRDGRGGTRIGTTRKNREGRVHRSILAREECEGVTRGATGVASETKETRGQKLFGEEGSERNASSSLTILHVQNGQLSVCGQKGGVCGQKGRKKEGK